MHYSRSYNKLPCAAFGHTKVMWRSSFRVVQVFGYCSRLEEGSICSRLETTWVKDLCMIKRLSVACSYLEYLFGVGVRLGVHPLVVSMRYLVAMNDHCGRIRSLRVRVHITVMASRRELLVVRVSVRDRDRIRNHARVIFQFEAVPLE
ncbi:hypothetical protein Tco_1424570, partial [Tanacetum coccineum]